MLSEKENKLADFSEDGKRKLIIETSKELAGKLQAIKFSSSLDLQYFNHLLKQRRFNAIKKFFITVDGISVIASIICIYYYFFTSDSFEFLLAFFSFFLLMIFFILGVSLEYSAFSSFEINNLDNMRHARALAYLEGKQVVDEQVITDYLKLFHFKIGKKDWPNNRISMRLDEEQRIRNLAEEKRIHDEEKRIHDFVDHLK